MLKKMSLRSLASVERFTDSMRRNASREARRTYASQLSSLFSETAFPYSPPSIDGVIVPSLCTVQASVPSTATLFWPNQSTTFPANSIGHAASDPEIYALAFSSSGNPAGNISASFLLKARQQPDMWSTRMAYVREPRCTGLGLRAILDG